MMNVRTNLFLIRGVDKTASVISWRNDRFKPVVYITYVGGKTYPYSMYDVVVLGDPQNISLAEKLLFCKGSPKPFAVEVQVFAGQYFRVWYKNGNSEIFRREDIRIIESALNDTTCRNCFEYLKTTASAVGLIADGTNILGRQYQSIEFVREDSVFATFLKGGKLPKSDGGDGTVVYPFGFNESQRRAIDHAMKNKLSVIEGPPGTGKTQTILNIVANAVMRGERVAVVSGNNAATANVYEKLCRYGVGFIAAQLGSIERKESFIANQVPRLPDMSSWNPDPRERELPDLLEELDLKLRLKNELSALDAEQDALEKEKAHFDDLHTAQDAFLKADPHIRTDKLLLFAAEYEYIVSVRKKIGLFTRLRIAALYGIGAFVLLGKPLDIVTRSCRRSFYRKRLSEIASRRKTIEKELEKFDFDSRMREYAEISMRKFKSALKQKYRSNIRTVYTAEDLRRKSVAFQKDYPVILSTTYSLRSCLSSEAYYDYVIIDEASQVDIATGALALSCADRAVIVGDLKQLPNVVDGKSKKMTDEIFSRFALPSAYRYSDNSLLSATVKLFPDVPRVLLKEHYRCHPEIIGFCNQRFYHGELIVLTKPRNNERSMVVYKTAAGNMARGHINERQIDVIVKEVFPQQHLSTGDGSVGIVTPYRDQADRLQSVFEGTNVKADTADKFQGQERSVMILSTVDNKISDFASDPNRLNVAVSRAVDRFIVVTDGNENDKTSPIHELIDYIHYHNHEIINSRISSVFDYLYRENAAAREKILRKYGRVDEYDSENLVFILIRSILSEDRFSRFDVAMHVPLGDLIADTGMLGDRERSFVLNPLTHIDFLIYSRVTHQPALAIEVDGFFYHNSEKQKERDAIKDKVLTLYDIPILRLCTTGSGERERVVCALTALITG